MVAAVVAEICVPVVLPPLAVAVTVLVMDVTVEAISVDTVATYVKYAVAPLKRGAGRVNVSGVVAVGTIVSRPFDEIKTAELDRYVK